MKKLSRNEPCHCGSGLKYKKCCLSKDEAANITRIAADRPPSLLELIEHKIDWPNELHRLIAMHFYNNTIGTYKEEEILNFVGLWSQYAQDELPVTRKLGTYAAALEYMLCQMYDYPVTKSKLAEKYDVSVATLTQRASQLHEFMDFKAEVESAGPSVIHGASPGMKPQMSMEREMAEIHKLLAEQDFNTIEEANAFLQQHLNRKPGKPAKRPKLTKKEQAAELLYSAMEEPVLERKLQLAQQALKLDPTNGDAYNLMAECAATPKEMAYFYKQAMQIEENQLGPETFKEYAGHFWGYMPTRPYMRARKGYAEACAMLDKMPEAIEHYEALLKLNPNDNQGVRELLVSAYIETLNWQAAEKLIEQFKEDNTATFAYSRVLVEYGLYGKTAKLNGKIRNATVQNPFVPAYLQGKKRLPNQMPEYVGFGDEREAIVYALLNRHLWLTRPELLRLLPDRSK